MDARDHPTTADYAAHSAQDNKREIAQLYALMELQTDLVLSLAKIVRVLAEDIQPHRPEQLRQVVNDLEQAMKKLKDVPRGRRH